MIANGLRALGFTLATMLVIIITIATLYATMWLVIGIALVMLTLASFKFLQAKETL